MMPIRLFSSEARGIENDSAGGYFISPGFNGLRHLKFEGYLVCKAICRFRCRDSEGSI